MAVVADGCEEGGWGGWGGVRNGGGLVGMLVGSMFGFFFLNALFCPCLFYFGFLGM